MREGNAKKANATLLKRERVKRGDGRENSEKTAERGSRQTNENCGLSLEF